MRILFLLLVDFLANAESMVILKMNLYGNAQVVMMMVAAAAVEH